MRKQFVSNRRITAMGYLLIFIACIYTLWLIYPISISRTVKVTKVATVRGAGSKNNSKQPSEWQSVLSATSRLNAGYFIPSIQDGLAPVVHKLQTDKKVVFLGIDDGVFKDQSVVNALKRHDIKASLFLSKNAIKNDPYFFNQLTEMGSVIENHTISHNMNMSEQNLDRQKAEICGMSDYEEEVYGIRPTLFRPPGGFYSKTTQKAVAACGLKAIIMWDVEVRDGKIEYLVGNKLRAGDIALIHFKPNFVKDVEVFAKAMKDSSLHTALLENAM